MVEDCGGAAPSHEAELIIEFEWSLVCESKGFEIHNCLWILVANARVDWLA